MFKKRRLDCKKNRNRQFFIVKKNRDRIGTKKCDWDIASIRVCKCVGVRALILQNVSQPFFFLAVPHRRVYQAS